MHLRLIGQLIGDLFRFSSYRTSLTFILMLIRSVTSGAGLLLIIPLLQLIGVSTGSSISNRIMITVTHVFQHLHLPLNLQTILASYIMLVCGVALIQYAEQVVGSALQQQYTGHLRTRLHGQLLHAQWPFFLSRKMSDLLYSLTAQVQGVSHCNHQLLSLINNLALTIVYTGLALVLSWPTTLFAIASAGFLLSLMLPQHKRTSQLGQRHLQQNQAIHHAISEQFGALKMIKSSGRETRFIDELQRIGSALDDQNQRLTLSTARSRFLYACGAVFLFSLLLDMAFSVFHVPVSSLLLLIFVFARLLPMVSSLQQTWQRILHQFPAYCDVKQLLTDCKAHQEDCANEDPFIFQQAITLQNISFQYTTHGRAVIHQLSASLPKNTTTAIVGPSGSGKSTLTDLMVGLLSPTDGHIFIDDQRLTPGKSLSWKKTVAYVTQDVFLFNASIRENLTMFSTHQTDEALWLALHDAAADFVETFEEGLDTMLGERGVRLSGGERQRIALARALLMNPQLLILDESTNALDLDNREKIQQALNQLRGKITLIIISHQPEMHYLVDQTIVLTPSHQGMNHVNHPHSSDTKALDAHSTSIV